ncbi:MAG: hypothetical protein IPL26_28240 [Leptospiraceae bacterium]|nr:hypothetical protein [Leptospiraceae bacterium]
MNEKYLNKYRIDSARRPGWDYSSSGYYFITIVTKNREFLFGEILGGIMMLSDMGRIVEEEWKRSFEIRRELIIDEFVIMPNHIHGIVYVDDTIRIDRDDEKSVVVEMYNQTHNETHSRASPNANASPTSQE